jgi:cytochrome c-type biogenesis protein CcmH/NrfG
MYNQLISNWRTFSEPERRAALAMADKEGQEAIAVEPEEWRLYLPLSTLFRLGSSLDSSYEARARALVEQATRLAPDRIEVNLHLVQLQIFEKDYGRAQESLDSYLERNPRAAPQFEGLQREIDRLTDQ